MNAIEFESFCTLLLKKANSIRQAKGKDYSSDGDRLSNFKKGANRLGIHVRQVWGNYFFKGIDAIETFVRTGKLESEPLPDRFADAINYLLLGAALLHEAGVCKFVEEDELRQMTEDRCAYFGKHDGAPVKKTDCDKCSQRQACLDATGD